MDTPITTETEDAELLSEELDLVAGGDTERPSDDDARTLGDHIGQVAGHVASFFSGVYHGLTD